MKLKQITEKLNADVVTNHTNTIIVNDPTYLEWIKTRRTNADKKGYLSYFLVYAGQACGREPFTPTEYKNMRIAELNASRGEDSEVKKLIWAFIEHLRHVCWACGEWIDKDPFDRASIPTMLHGDSDASICHFKKGTNKGDPGKTLAPNSRNNYFITTRGFLTNTISDPSASPFKKGENLDEFGWSQAKKFSLDIDTWRALIDHATPPQALTLWVLRQTGMSGDASSLRITSDVENQLGMRLTADATRDDSNNDLPDVVLFDWKRKKAMRGRADATIQRRTALYGEAVSALVKMIRKKHMVRGDPILMGQKGQPVTTGQMRAQVAEVIALAGIRTGGETLGPHVLRGEAYTDYMNAKSEMFAKYMTGKQLAIDQMTYWNARPDELKAIIRTVIPRNSISGELKKENRSLKEKMSYMVDKVSTIEAEMRMIKEDYANLVHANRQGMFDHEVNKVEDPRDKEIKDLRELVIGMSKRLDEIGNVKTQTLQEGG